MDLTLTMGWLLLMISSATAQFAMVSGTVTDQANGHPIQGVNVVLRSDGGVVYGTATEGAGTFVLNRIRPGTYVLRASFLGYIPFSDTLEISFDDNVIRPIMLTADQTKLEEIIVEPETKGAIQENIAGLQTIQPADLARIPMPDVNSDLMAYLLTMPGVVSSGDRGGQLYVRGGTPTQNLVLIDGIPVYQPFHIIGFYSAFPADILSYANVYAGGFNARYGGRLSSVIDVATRNGDKEHYKGAGSLAPFLSSIRLEGPLLKGKVSVLGSLRESIIERIAGRLITDPLPYRFGDRFLKLHAYLNRTSSASFTLLRTFDEGNLAGDLDADTRTSWENAAYGGKYVYLPEEYPALVELAIAISRLKTAFSPFAGPERSASVRGINATINFSYLTGAQEVHFGIAARSLSFEFELESTRNKGAFVTEGALFAELLYPLGSTLELRPGFRLHTFPSQNTTSLEPRFQATWKPAGVLKGHIFNTAWGIYRQEIIGLNDNRDVSGVFTAWAPTPPGTEIPKATHFILGWSTRPKPWLNVKTEGYAKALSNLTVFTGNTGFRSADGTVRGIDTRLEVTRPLFYGFIGYSLSSVWYETGAIRFRPSHDRRHFVNMMGRLVRGSYALSIRWSLGSGLPFTQAAGFYDELTIRTPNDSYETDLGTAQVVYSTPFQGRLPTYHRLDVSVERSFDFKHVTGKMQAGVVNAYNRSNLFYYDIFSARRINQLPLIPSIGLKVEVR